MSQDPATPGTAGAGGQAGGDVSLPFRGTMSHDPDASIDGPWVAATRASLASLQGRLQKRFDDGDDIDRLLGLRTRSVDHALREAWERCGLSGSGLSLFAVGGYGRGELYPCSDIDLLALGGETAQQRCEPLLARFFALLWDAGLAASHAVRSPAQCTVAAADQTVLTALLEARPLVAVPEEADALLAAIGPDRVWPARDFFLAKREEQRVRHARFGDTADNLEPNLKDGPGGLRDLQTLGWMALRTFGAVGFEAVVALGHLGADEALALDRERRALARLRFGLHLVAGRPEERLRFDFQKTLATRLGFHDDEESLGVEQMMQGFYRSAAVMRRINDRLLQRFEEQFDGAALPVALTAEFAEQRGYLSARDSAWPSGDPARVFALFAAWASHAHLDGLHSQTARALAEALPALPAYPDASPAARTAFMDLLRGPNAVGTLNRMARLGVLAQWLPAFARVSGRMQFDLFHVYTVDQHTLMVLRNMASFAGGIAEDRFSIAHEVWPKLRKPELLLLAGLFHDIAKGRGGDHSELGMADAIDFCRAHGLGEGDTDLVAWLVQQHLRMSVTAQKQDIADPAVIMAFATLVGDRERLDYLYLLTCADIAGTSPKLWNAWKDRLLADLYFATRRVLREGLETPRAHDERVQEAKSATRALMAARGYDDAMTLVLFATMPDDSFLRGRPEQVAWQAGILRGLRPGETRIGVRRIERDSNALEVFVHSPDRDGLFAAILATLDRFGYGVHQARVLLGPMGTVFDTFEVTPASGFADPDPAELRERLAEVLAAPLHDVRVARRAMPRLLKHFRFAPQIEFRDSADGQRTVLSLACTDRPGLLADLAQVLRRHQLRVHDARIATFGARAEDVFQISDEHDHPLPDDPRRQALRDDLRACLEGDPTPGVTA